jgi:hypothetical protein
MNELLDYHEEGFILPLQRNHIRTYASVNAEMVYDKHELAPTGHYFVYLLHPERGSCHFTIRQEIATGLWFSKDAPVFVEADIILEIGTAINFKKQPISVRVFE